MRDYKFFIFDAFAHKAFQGNPAGIVIDQGRLSDQERLALAGELKMSETAFIERLDINDYRIRYFTPVEEVDLCGHASIASFYMLAQYDYIEGLENGVKEVLLRSKAGNLPIYLTYKNGALEEVTMTQSDPQEFGQVKDIGAMAKALGLRKEDFYAPEDLPMEKISTGIRDLMVPLKSRQALTSIQADMDALVDLSKKYDYYSVHAFCQEGGKIYQRNFCPILGIPEEAATGTSTGALLHYLNKHQGQRSLRAIQGLEMNRPSEILASYQGEPGKEKITVGGRACLVVEGVLHV